MKRFVIGLLTGIILSGTIAFGINELNIYENPYPIRVNYVDKDIKGYNINDSTYFKLRDISDALDNSFSVDFHDDTIFINNRDTSSYKSYIGAYNSKGGSLGFDFRLAIYDADDRNITFSYMYDKPGFGYDMLMGTFTDMDVAVAKGTVYSDFAKPTKVVYILLFEQGKIILTECSEEDYNNNNYDINNGRVFERAR